MAFVLGLVIAFIYIERRFMGRMQARLGPNRTGPFGLLQPLADAVKLMLKEDIVPGRGRRCALAGADRSVGAGTEVFAVIPFTDGAALADLNIGILYVMAIGSVAGMGIIMAGWGVEQQVLAARRDARYSGHRELRDPAGNGRPRRGPHRRLALAERHR